MQNLFTIEVTNSNSLPSCFFFPLYIVFLFTCHLLFGLTIDLYIANIEKNVSIRQT